jgi:anthranilate phosphoribosyltransferase
MIQKAIANIAEGKDLPREVATQTLIQIMNGEATGAQIAAFLVGLRMKGESIEEITGLAQAMRSMATRIEPARRPLVDTCGTGGDASGTFNISTAAAFVVAGAGVAVAKHGNRSASSKCGSADVLEALGVNIEVAPEVVTRCIDEFGFGFMFARSFHAAMKHVAPVRQELKLRTVFNILGPLTNPAGADGQVMGVYDEALVEPIAHVLHNLGIRRAFIVSGEDGLDEISLSVRTRIAEVTPDGVTLGYVCPEDAGIRSVCSDALLGDDAQTNAAMIQKILEGEPGPCRDVVVLNAAAGILAGEDGPTDWKAAAAKAAESIDSGSALRVLTNVAQLTAGEAG